ncbi:MAG: SprT family zinc-dependent metalloprotease [Gemmataceae bacterium]
MGVQIQLGELAIEVVFKDIKNLHLSVHPPAGRVSISAPRRMDLDVIRVFAISKLAWIHQQQKKIRKQEREPEREYIDRESHYVWGRRYLLTVVEQEKPPAIVLRQNTLAMSVRPGTDTAKRGMLMESWYREQLRKAIPPIVTRWEPLMGVQVARYFVQRMRTRWGSCNPRARNLRFNTDLARKPRECLEYVVVHEMTHLLEPTHNARFIALMDRFMPNWRQLKQALNRLPVRHEDWEY